MKNEETAADFPHFGHFCLQTLLMLSSTWITLYCAIRPNPLFLSRSGSKLTSLALPSCRSFIPHERGARLSFSLFSTPMNRLSHGKHPCRGTPSTLPGCSGGTAGCARSDISSSTPVFTTKCWLYPGLFFWTADIFKQKKKCWRFNTSTYR